ncbi:glycosyltransferase [Terriglobus saanensis]|uniref:Glycosyltransferase, MGT family n=1 Tax=Terriglobus saanensis (strain ATCC BAA-1853 / DSM 23119 / SP1PR4) TaxID=401053 RepID=E8V2X3_TERSS|nr:nucleotide disphospho-sugar-binding domain-containing protein [Terriglobus saanensis]ADV84670.1 glycosyltransferase, MGT family [Terriglobus saanensis SP1PR4]
MRVAFLGVRVPGHLNPTTTLARKLQARGHDVVFLSVPDTEPFVRAAQLPYVPFSEKDFPVGSLAKSLDQLNKLKGQEALEMVMRLVSANMESAFRNLPQALQDVKADALVLDESERGLGCVPMHLGMPYVHISNALPIDLAGITPVCTFDWPHETTPEARTRNQAGVRSLLRIYEPILSVARAYAERVGLKIDWSDPYATISPLGWLTQMPREFDFESSHWPPSFHYTGPFHDGLGRIESDFPWDRLTGEPLIYASMGTLQNGLESVFQTIAEAVGTRPGMQLVLSIGPALDPEKISPLPHNCIVVKNAPQMELLKRAALCITHAGLNTALESLTQGVPMVAVPVSIDQPGVAARIAYTKTGKFVPIKELTVPRLAALIDEVLSNPEYRQNAMKMKEAIVRTNGLEKAADLIEQAFHLSPKSEAHPLAAN